MNHRTCSVEDCDRPTMARGWCSKHWQRWKAHGDPLGGRRRYTSFEESYRARTEWRGDCLVWTGSVTGKGYGRFAFGGESKSVHRYAWERENGPIPEGMQVDHICWNKLCSNVEHLRLASSAQNKAYMPGATIRSVTGVRNVSIVKGKYQVSVQRGKDRRYGGSFATLEEAAAAAYELRREMFGEFMGGA